MRSTQNHERGMTMIQFALLLVVIFGFVALTVDYGLMVVTQRHLQNSTDAAAFAAGPDLGPLVGGTDDTTAEKVAKDYLVYNKVDGPEYTRSADHGNYELVVTATKDVNVPFQNVVEELTQQWSYGFREVQGRSKVIAELNVNQGWLAPLAIQKSYLDTDMEKIWGKPVDLLMQVKFKAGQPTADPIIYVDDPGNPLNPNDIDIQANVVAIDLYNSQSIDDYIDILENGPDDRPLHMGLAPDGKTWRMRSFDIETYQAWADATAEGYRRILLKAPTSNYPVIKAEDPRFMVIMLTQRVEGSGQKDFDCSYLGLVGFYLENVYYRTDIAQPSWAIRGRFVQYTGAWDGKPRVVPPDSSGTPILGVRTFRLVPYS